ncbi:MAG TPA: cache domain-containing protein, partial [Myxococcota bacterium]|nr:cache domain-containing protein [Myxococcota bacterium]
METDVREALRRAARQARLRVERGLARQGWLQTLPSRLVLGVFSTVLLTSFAVAVTATHSTEAFLRDGIDQRFPAVLAQAAKRMDLWYDQRQLDVDTFARSEIVRDHLQALAEGRRGQRATRAREELQHYLDYVLERFPQYKALFLLDREGQTVLWVGAEMALPDALRDGLAGLAHARVSDLQVADGVRSQMASAPVPDGNDRPIGSLHAVLALEELDALVHTDDLSTEGRILVVRDEQVLAPADAGAVPDDAPPSGEVAELELPDGDSVIASRLGFERFGWSLWVVEPYDAAFAPVVAVIQRVWAVNLAIVLLLGAVAFAIARSMARPIHELSRAAHAIAGGAE